MPRKEKQYHFIYKTLNIVNNKYYIGMHSTDDLNDGYLGSGKKLTRSIKKYGKANFRIQVLEYHTDRKSLIEAEKRIVSLEEITSPLCMNLMTGGSGGYVSEENQRRRSLAGSKALQTKLKNDPEFHESFKHNISKGLKNAYATGKLNRNWSNKNRGNKLTDEHKRKIGEQNSIYQKGERNSQYGTCWVNRDGVNKKIKKEEIESLLLAGWSKGTFSYITVEILNKIRELLTLEMSHRKISKIMNIPKSTITRNIKKYNLN